MREIKKDGRRQRTERSYFLLVLSFVVKNLCYQIRLILKRPSKDGPSYKKKKKKKNSTVLAKFDQVLLSPIFIHSQTNLYSKAPFTQAQINAEKCA